MFNENTLYLAKHRINTAKEDLDTAKDMLRMERYKGATNRAYYAIFHSIRAILALESVDFKKHSAVISYFRQNYVKTGIFDMRIAEIIQNASFVKNESDYSDFFIASKEDALRQVENADLLLQEVVKYLKTKVNL